MGLSCTKVQGPKQRNVQGPVKKGTRFWKKLRRTTPKDMNTATMAEGGHEMASDCPAGNQQDDNGQQESSPLDEAGSDLEKNDGQQVSSPLDEAGSDLEKNDGQQESSPLDEAGSDLEKNDGQQENSPLDEACSDLEKNDGQQESSPLDEANSDEENVDGQQESSPLDEAGSDLEKNDGQQESSPHDEAGSDIEKIDRQQLRCRIIRSRLGRGTQTARAAAPRLRSKLDRRPTKSESDLGKAPVKQKRRMRQFNRRRPFPKGTKSDTELVRPTRVQP